MARHVSAADVASDASAAPYSVQFMLSDGHDHTGSTSSCSPIPDNSIENDGGSCEPLGSSSLRPPYETSTTAAGLPAAVTRKPPCTRFRGQRRWRRTPASDDATVARNS